MNTFKVTVDGVTPHTIEARNRLSAIKKTRTTWPGRKFGVVEWKPYTVESLIEELQQFAGNTPVCFPASGGTSQAQFLPVIMGVSAVETVPAWGFGKEAKAKTMVCFESHVISSNAS